MNFLDTLQYEPISNLSIEIGENKAGWLDLTLSSLQRHAFFSKSHAEFYIAKLKNQLCLTERVFARNY